MSQMVHYRQLNRPAVRTTNWISSFKHPRHCPMARLNADVMDLILTQVDHRTLRSLCLISFQDIHWLAARLLYNTIRVNRRNIVKLLYTILTNPTKASLVRHMRIELNKRLVAQTKIRDYIWTAFVSAALKLGFEQERHNILLDALLRGACDAHAAILVPNLPNLLSLNMLYPFNLDDRWRGWPTGAVGFHLLDPMPYFETVTHLTLENTLIPASFQDVVRVLRMPRLEYLKTDIEGSLQNLPDPSDFVARSNKNTHLNIYIDQEAGLIFPAIVSTCTALQHVSFSDRNRCSHLQDPEEKAPAFLSANNFIHCLRAHKRSIRSISYLSHGDRATDLAPMHTLEDFQQLEALSTSPDLFGSCIQSPDLWARIPSVLRILEIRAVTVAFWLMLKYTHDALADRSDLLPQLSRLEVEFDIPYYFDEVYEETEEEKETILMGFQKRGIDLEWRDEGDTELED